MALKRAKLAYYYGWSHYEIMNLPIDVCEEYWLAITNLEAQELLMQCKVSDHPHGKRGPRKKFHKELSKMAYANIDYGDGKPVTTAKIAANLARKLMGGGR